MNKELMYRLIKMNLIDRYLLVVGDGSFNYLNYKSNSTIDKILFLKNIKVDKVLGIKIDKEIADLLIPFMEKPLEIKI
jgi:hypothetical protein